MVMWIHKLGGAASKDYSVSAVAIGLTIFSFFAVLVYAVDPAFDATAVMVLSSIAFAGVSMGLLLGVPSISTRVKSDSLMWGITVGMILLVTSAVIKVTASLSIAKLLYLYAAVAEEWGFRYGLQRLLAKVWNPWVAWVGQAFAFMIYHWVVYPDVTVIAFPLVAGLLLGAVHDITKDLSAPMLAHFMNNLYVVLLT